MTTQSLCAEIRERLAKATPRELYDYLDAFGPTDLARLLAIVELQRAALEDIAQETRTPYAACASQALQACDKLAGEE